MTEAGRNVEVLLVTGTGRSGSTVAANLLGEADGAVSVGELRYVFERGIVEDRLCGCGERFSACPRWTTVLDVAGVDVADAPALGRELAEVLRIRRLADVRPSAAASDELLEVLGRLYQAVVEVSGARVVVDSSKLPTYASLLRQVPGVRSSLAHLIRDPRAVAHSWTRQRAQPDRGAGVMMERRAPLKSAALWNLWNSYLLGARAVPGTRAVVVRYEALVTDPEPSLTHMADLVGLEAPRPTGPATFQVGTHHTVAGNPVRLASGPTVLALDDEWRTAMSSTDRRVVSAVTAPVRAALAASLIRRTRGGDEPGR